jgi:hypothetical protein
VEIVLSLCLIALITVILNIRYAKHVKKITVLSLIDVIAIRFLAVIAKLMVSVRNVKLLLIWSMEIVKYKIVKPITNMDVYHANADFTWVVMEFVSRWEKVA